MREGSVSTTSMRKGTRGEGGEGGEGRRRREGGERLTFPSGIFRTVLWTLSWNDRVKSDESTSSDSSRVRRAGIVGKLK